MPEGGVQQRGVTDHTASGAPLRETVCDVLIGFCHSPKARLIRRWNWKAAILSALVRAVIFFAANLTAGRFEALAAMAREFIFRAAASGFYGGMTESFRAAQPRWAATLTALVLLPVLNHSAEFALHWSLGTANLKTSISASVMFTVFSTGFNLFAMRRGVLITSGKPQSLSRDLVMVPGLILSYCGAILQTPGLFLLSLAKSRRKLLRLSSLHPGPKRNRKAIRKIAASLVPK